MAELADAADSKSADLRVLGVRLPLPAPSERHTILASISHFCISLPSLGCGIAFCRRFWPTWGGRIFTTGLGKRSPIRSHSPWILKLPLGSVSITISATCFPVSSFAFIGSSWINSRIVRTRPIAKSANSGKSLFGFALFLPTDQTLQFVQLPFTGVECAGSRTDCEPFPLATAFTRLFSSVSSSLILPE